MLRWCDDLYCLRGSPVFIPRDYSRQHTGRMAESRMGDVEACPDQELEDKEVRREDVDVTSVLHPFQEF